jgi:hypothetical protein
VNPQDFPAGFNSERPNAKSLTPPNLRRKLRTTRASGKYIH